MKKPYTLHSMQKRIISISIVLVFLACCLGIRLFFVQIIKGNSLQIKATDQWTRDLSLTAPRGTIYDSTGDTLAVSYTTYNVYVRAREVTFAEGVANVLSQLLDLDYEKTLQKVENKSVSETLLKMQVESDIAEQIYNLQLSGVYLSENVGRYYIYGDLMTQLLGFTSIDNVGQSGIEAYFNDYLTGVDGYSYVQSDLQGKEIGGTLSDPSVNIAKTVTSFLATNASTVLSVIDGAVNGTGNDDKGVAGAIGGLLQSLEQGNKTEVVPQNNGTSQPKPAEEAIGTMLNGLFKQLEKNSR